MSAVLRTPRASALCGRDALLAPAARHRWSATFLVPARALDRRSSFSRQGGTVRRLCAPPRRRRLSLASSSTRSCIAIVVTVVALVIAFPIAFALTRLSRTWRGIVFALRAAAAVDQRARADLLLDAAAGAQRADQPLHRRERAQSTQPLCLCCSTTPRVLIGMVHVLLPYAVLPIYAALVRIDPALLRASEGLGASDLHHVSPRAAAALAAGAWRPPRRSPSCCRSASS